MSAEDTNSPEHLERLLHQVGFDATAAKDTVAQLDRSLAQMRSDYDGMFRDIAGDLGDLDQRLASGAARPAGGPGGQVWSEYEASEQDLDEQMQGLRDWFTWANPTIFYYRVTPPRPVPDCWEQHPGAVEELLGLYSAWRAAYAGADPSQNPTYWHGVFAGPALERIMKAYRLADCADRGHHRAPMSVATVASRRQNPTGATDVQHGTSAVVTSAAPAGQS